MKRLRTFIAVDLGKSIRDRLVSLQERLAQTGAPVKWVEIENLHVTLLFLGEVDPRDVPAVCRAAADVCKDHVPFMLSVQGVSCFGNPRRPRTLWVGTNTGSSELCTLHDALEPPLLDLGCYRREERQFTPHITIGRVKIDRPNDTLAAALTKLSDWQAGQVQVREILVLSSELTSDGPIYTVLSRAKLHGV
jgi:RNA 2',3'-cyclic 3'-phosphodiesterase